MTLVDTSAWVEFDRATGSAVDQRLTTLIAGVEEVAVTEPVIMEVIAGARDAARERDLRRPMDRFLLLRFDAAFGGTPGIRTCSCHRESRRRSRLGTGYCGFYICYLCLFWIY